MRDPETADLPATLGQSPAGGPGLAREIVAFTRGTARRYNRSRSELRDVLLDLYASVLAVGCVAAIAVSFVLALRDQIAERGVMEGSLVTAGGRSSLPRFSGSC